MNAESNLSGLRAAGVQELIDKLQRDGVEAGRSEAERLIADGQAEAERIRAEARGERDRMLAAATAEAERLSRAAEAGLSLAYRDTILHTREALIGLFGNLLSAHVAGALSDPGLVAGLVRLSAERLAGETAMLVETALDPDACDRLTAMLASELADEEIVLKPGGVSPGIVARRDGGKLSLELTDETIARLILAHLRPRLRALFAMPAP